MYEEFHNIILFFVRLEHRSKQEMFYPHVTDVETEACPELLSWRVNGTIRTWAPASASVAHVLAKNESRCAWRETKHGWIRIDPSMLPGK